MSKSEKILIVDDQYGIRTLLTLVFEKYDVKEAENGQQALELVESWKPDLVIIDMKMPVLNGPDTISSIKKMKFKPKILLMTAYDENYLINDKDISGFVSKPFDLDKLVTMVDEILQNS
ncbi:MAG: response regulator [Peptococcales bacterium]|jgi:two-component system response regulator (stage 0 sporulation protein F)